MSVFFLDPKYFRPLYVGSGIWKDYGFHSIIYISTIMSVDPTLYESAKIDGISKFGEVRVYYDSHDCANHSHIVYYAAWPRYECRIRKSIFVI